MSKDIINTIAAEILGITTLESRDSDRLDFHEVSAVAVTAALEAAYAAGATSAAIRKTLDVMDTTISEILRRSSEAKHEIAQGRDNAAIGAILGMEELLADALALHRAARAIHRHSR